MDAIITLEEVTGFLKNPPSLAPRPDFNQLRAIRQHIVRALKQLTCPQSAIHRWSGLAITLAMYLLIEPQPFAGSHSGEHGIELGHGRYDGTCRRKYWSWYRSTR
jgi:hypothetical protein